MFMTGSHRVIIHHEMVISIVVKCKDMLRDCIFQGISMVLVKIIEFTVDKPQIICDNIGIEIKVMYFCLSN